jgi:two-component system response regulator HydG
MERASATTATLRPDDPGWVVVVDDDTSNAESVRKTLEREGLPVRVAVDGKEALQLLRKERVSVLLTDLMMPGVDGMALLRAAAVTSPATAVVLMTAYGTVEAAVEAMKEGAWDFITKPLRRADLVRAATRARERAALRTENAALKSELQKVSHEREIIGNSPALRQAVDVLDQVAPARATVLLLGESGTGKEVFARRLHRQSQRRGAFVAINCAAIPDSLLESELFGHERGAFTGAISTTQGRFQQADGGTLLLDEIAELPLPLQAKLLRVLQEGEVQRVGGSQVQRVDVRVVAATNRDLQAEVDAGRFRADLFYRLHVVAIELPPLRSRPSDIPALAQHFIGRFCSQNQRPLLALTAEALTQLQSWEWPGNVRELENVLERAVVLCRGPVIGVGELPDKLGKVSEPQGQAMTFTVGTPLEEIERTVITETLRVTGGDKRRAAMLLGISLRSVYRKIGDQEEGADVQAETNKASP